MVLIINYGIWLINTYAIFVFKTAIMTYYKYYHLQNISHLQILLIIVLEVI